MENRIELGDCREVLGSLADSSVGMVFTSPPYASQRKRHYQSVSEAEYPAWTVAWMEAVKPKLAVGASVFVVIRPHIRNGELSNYVLRTRLAVREAGWVECEELIWLKADAPPLGSRVRPRRVWESVLWFSLTGKPYADLLALGNPTSRIGFAGSDRFGGSVVCADQNREMGSGVARCTDVLRANIGEISRGVMHPAMFPGTLSDQAIACYSKIGDLVVDPFCGSGTTCLSAAKLGRRWFGIDSSPDYVEIARKRLQAASAVASSS